MFLTRGVLHHEATWTAWLHAASGLLPRASIRNLGCSHQAVKKVVSVCTPTADATVLAQQHLFNVLVHVSGSTPNWKGACSRILHKVVATTTSWAEGV